MNGSPVNPVHCFLPLYAGGVILATLFLLFVGAMVTTRDAGLAVPDWPLSFGSVNPPGWWERELIRLEHGHRLTGAAIGVLTTGLAVWVWIANRGCGLAWLGPAVFVAVVVQGVLGGLRVTETSTSLAIVHGCFGQFFFCLLVAIAVVHTRTWRDRFRIAPAGPLRRLRRLAVLFLAAAFLQLVLGAVMRHHKAGLAIPDFPLAFGRLVPPVRGFEIDIHYAHRVWALAVAGLAFALWWTLRRGWRAIPALRWGGSTLLALTCLQIGLGASVIWTHRAPVPTCLHVVNGALVLGVALFVGLHAFAVRTHGPLFASDSPVDRRGMESEEVTA